MLLAHHHQKKVDAAALEKQEFSLTHTHVHTLCFFIFSLSVLSSPTHTTIVLTSHHQTSPNKKNVHTHSFLLSNYIDSLFLLPQTSSLPMPFFLDYTGAAEVTSSVNTAYLIPQIAGVGMCSRGSGLEYAIPLGSKEVAAFAV